MLLEPCRTCLARYTSVMTTATAAKISPSAAHSCSPKGMQSSVESAATEIPHHDSHAKKLLVMIGRGDGWMGLSGGR